MGRNSITRLICWGLEGLRSNYKLSLSTFASVLVLLMCATFDVFAESVSISYTDANSQAQTLAVDANSSAADLALAAVLMGHSRPGYRK